MRFRRRDQGKALELDLLSPSKMTSVADTLYLARRYDEAEAQHRNALETDPKFGYAHWGLGRVLMARGEYADAIPALERSIPLSGDSPDETAELARAYALGGRRAEAVELLERLPRVAARRYVAPSTFAALHAALGDSGRSRGSRRRRDFLLVTIRVEPMFDKLRHDERFTTLLEVMKLSSPASVSPRRGAGARAAQPLP